MVTNPLKQWFALGTLENPVVRRVPCGCAGTTCAIDQHSFGQHLFLTPSDDTKFAGYSVDVLGAATIEGQFLENADLFQLYFDKKYLLPGRGPGETLHFTLPTKGWETVELTNGLRHRVVLANGMYVGHGALRGNMERSGRASLVLFEDIPILSVHNLRVLQDVLGKDTYLTADELLRLLLPHQREI